MMCKEVQRVSKALEEAKARWNREADEWNQWHELGRDEKLTLILEPMNKMSLFEKISEELDRNSLSVDENFRVEYDQEALEIVSKLLREV